MIWIKDLINRLNNGIFSSATKYIVSYILKGTLHTPIFSGDYREVLQANSGKISVQFNNFSNKNL